MLDTAQAWFGRSSSPGSVQSCGARVQLRRVTSSNPQMTPSLGSAKAAASVAGRRHPIPNSRGWWKNTVSSIPKAPLLRCDVYGRAVDRISEMVQEQHEMFPGSSVNPMFCPYPAKHAQSFQIRS